MIAVLVAAASASATNVTDIRIEGNQRIDPTAIQSYLGLKAGQTISTDDLDLGLKKLYATGFFADVGVSEDNGVITVHVAENPSISAVIFEGNHQINKEDLEKEITLKARSVYTRTKVQADLKRLLDVYRRHGRYSAEITPQLIQLEQNRVNLVYNIVEGPKAYIEKISFIGNDSYASKTLEKVISSSRERWYQFLTDSDKYDPDRLQYDQELLRKFYLENGYADFKVKSAIAELSPQRDQFFLTFTVEEGDRYHLGKVDVQTKLPNSKIPDLQPSISSKTGDVYNATEIEDSINRMIDVLGDHGFAFVDINPDIVRVPGDQKLIDLTYNITEGPKVYVERINIFGNQRTLDDVVRREFKLGEGDAYSSSKIKRTEQRLNNLGFFEKVNIERKPGSAPDKANLDVQVTEKSTGEISLGAGYSTSDGPIADVGIRERNFLGRGQDARARVQFGGKRQQYDLSFTEPYFLDRELEAGVDLTKLVQNYQDNSSFDRKTTGGTLRLGYSLSEHLKHQLRYSLNESDISNVSSTASRFIKDQAGTSMVSMIGHSFTYDRRDSRLSPTSGYYLRLNQDVAGLGGDEDFIRHEVQSEGYYPIAKQWTLAGYASGGNVSGLGQDVRINQRFFTGGQEIRGFANAGVGPRDITTGDALGANNYIATTAELRFPLGLPDDLGVSGATFVDAGSAWGIDETGPEVRDDPTARAALGVGLAWASPFGPIRIDIARAFLKQDYDRTEILRFNFGTRF